MPRLRIIAGPNGSGKTHLTNFLRANFELNWGQYINADEIEKELREKRKISFNQYDLNGTNADFEAFYNSHPLKDKAGASFKVIKKILTLKDALVDESYFSTLVADFIRQGLMKSKKSFSFETVMSGSDKIGLLQQAKAANYQVYLYFICTENPLINIDRVAYRVQKSGHFVPAELITNRYLRTLENLWQVLNLVDRAYLFDNSGREHKLHQVVNHKYSLI